MNRRQRKQQQTLYVNVYTIDRAYGGAEEGGWWFDVGQFMRPAGTFFNREKAWDFAEELNDLIDKIENDPRGYRSDLSSVCCEGRIQACVEDHPGHDFPEYRPHYE